MDSKIAMFAVLAIAAIFAMITPIDYAFAQAPDAMPDGEGGEEGKSCPAKEKAAFLGISNI